MLGKLTRQNGAPAPSSMEGQIDVLLDRAVYAYMIDELHKYPDQEEGGKYVGYLLQNGSPLRRDLGIGNEGPVSAHHGLFAERSECEAQRRRVHARW